MKPILNVLLLSISLFKEFNCSKFGIIFIIVKVIFVKVTLLVLLPKIASSFPHLVNIKEFLTS
jgi:hypothetical protein